MEPVVEVRRGGIVESVHRFSAAVVDANGRFVTGCGNPNLVAYLRSSAKPFQAVPFIESGAADSIGATSKEIAVATGSHGGEPDQVAVVSSLLSRAGLSEKYLLCGRHRPYNENVAAELGNNYSEIHHNCSGKHAAMLATAKHLHEPLETYQAASHVVQMGCRAVLADVGGLAESRVVHAVDGCGVPTFAMPLTAMARAFASLASPAGKHERSLARVRDSMLAHPEMVSWRGNMNLALMRAFPRAVGKAGAEGLFCVGLPVEGHGVAVKVEDGASRAVAPATLAVLAALGYESSELAEFGEPAVKNFAGKPVGRISARTTLRPPPQKEK